MNFYILFILAVQSLISSSSATVEKSLLEQQSFITTNSKIQYLNQFFKNNSPLNIHNKALDLLKNKNKIPATLLLKKNFYQNLFPESYLLLGQLEEAVFLFPVFLLIGFAITSLITVIFFIFYLKTLNSFYLKNLLISLFLFVLLLGGHFFLKGRVSPITENHLKLAPVETAPHTVQIAPLENLVVLKKQDKWLKVKNNNNQTGWILRQQVFQLF